MHEAAGADRRALLGGLGVSAAGSWLVVQLGLAGPLPALGGVLVYGLGALLVGLTWRRPRLGVANLVTLVRLVGVGWVAAGALQAVAGDLSLTGRLTVIVLGTGCLVLDGVDGRVARARGETSDFGAVFDVETDGALLITLSVAVAALGVTGWWVLAVGGTHYVHLVVSRLVPALQVPLYPSLARKVVAVAQGVALLLALTLDLVIPGLAASVVGVLALALLTWSFGRDIAWQLGVARSRDRI